MNFIAVAVACVVLFVGAYVGENELHNQTQENESIETHEVLSTEDSQPLEQDENNEIEETPQPEADRPLVETVTLTPTIAYYPSSSPIPTSSSSTSINTETNVKVYAKDGEKYAEINGKEVQLDANGCYTYENGGTKIHACVNN